ncbi:MAG TPA: hypothetical protein VFM05_11450, partial [Candidatus Saccharimonadales bacterium]|nr:hypothetical protein [Candidatus Saccharimonadales bacterium]
MSDAMREITKLTRAQKLVEATRLIQLTLRDRESSLDEGKPEQPQTHERTARFKRPLGEVVNILRRAKQSLEIPAPK